jgi:hypothetical protein
MDRNELEVSLQYFRAACQEKGKPLADMCIIEAYPGDISTSYIIQVKADWVEEMDCSDAIDFLFDTLWETSDENIRKNIFSIEVLDSNDQLHCWHENSAELENKNKN